MMMIRTNNNIFFGGLAYADIARCGHCAMRALCFLNIWDYLERVTQA